MIVVDETKNEIKIRLQESKVLIGFIRENKEIDSDDFYKLAGDIIDELYGKLEHKNFRSISHAAPWFNERQNLLRDLLEDSGVQITHKEVEERPKLNFNEWVNKYQ